MNVTPPRGGVRRTIAPVCVWL